ncbi:hypothetical protein LSAT2_008159 [Lamellibrachia satsuma]|nr:hypothetical protein LSAT2_008159 [Lamellibrachia satsuma]
MFSFVFVSLNRASNYLKECAATRVIALTGFFLSLPTFLSAFLLFVLMEFRTTPAVVATVIITVGVTFSVTSAIHSTYIWQVERAREVTLQLTSPLHQGGGEVIQSELSTLV